MISNFTQLLVKFLQNISEKMFNILWNYCQKALCPRFTQLFGNFSQRNSLRADLGEDFK